MREANIKLQKGKLIFILSEKQLTQKGLLLKSYSLISKYFGLSWYDMVWHSLIYRLGLVCLNTKFQLPAMFGNGQ